MSRFVVGAIWGMGLLASMPAPWPPLVLCRAYADAGVLLQPLWKVGAMSETVIHDAISRIKDGCVEIEMFDEEGRTVAFWRLAGAPAVDGLAAALISHRHHLWPYKSKAVAESAFEALMDGLW